MSQIAQSMALMADMMTPPFPTPQKDARKSLSQIASFALASIPRIMGAKSFRSAKQAGAPLPMAMPASP